MNRKGENNPRWKGKNAGYQSKHQYLKRNFGSPKQCEFCGIEGKKESGGRWSINWAKKHGREYTHNREDYLELCRVCHGKYDLTDDKTARLRYLANNQTPEQRAKLSIKRRQIALNRKRDGTGHFIKRAA
jgi:hypothetical protein